jgi:hypothetical protein
MTTDLLDPDAVTNRESFLRFVQALITDRETADAIWKKPIQIAISGEELTIGRTVQFQRS